MLPIGQLIGTLPSSAGWMSIDAHLYECQLYFPLLRWAPQDRGPQDLLYHPVGTHGLPISLRVVSHAIQEVGT